MITRSPKHHPGIDCSGESKVLPPTFVGVKALVQRLGFDLAAESVKGVSEPDDASHDLVRDFLSDLDFMDAVERQTAISEFSAYVADLESKSNKQSTPQPEPSNEPEPGAAAQES